MGGSLRPGFRRQSVSLSLQVCTVTSITRRTGSLIKLANILGTYGFFFFFLAQHIFVEYTQWGCSSE